MKGSRASDECGIEHGAASVREQERALSAAAIFRDAVGIGEREQGADAGFFSSPFGAR